MFHAFFFSFVFLFDCFFFFFFSFVCLFRFNHRYRNISGLVTVDDSGVVVGCNETFVLLLFGVSEAEILGKPITTLLPGTCAHWTHAICALKVRSSTCAPVFVHLYLPLHSCPLSSHTILSSLCSLCSYLHPHTCPLTFLLPLPAHTLVLSLSTRICSHTLVLSLHLFLLPLPATKVRTPVLCILNPPLDDILAACIWRLTSCQWAAMVNSLFCYVFLSHRCSSRLLHRQ